MREALLSAAHVEVLDALANLGVQGDVEAYCQAAGSRLQQTFGLKAATFAWRLDFTLPWETWPHDPLLEDGLGMQPLAVPGEAVRMQLGGREVCALGLAVAAPQQAVLLLPPDADPAPLLPVLPALGLGLSNGLYGRSNAELERAFGEMSRKLRAIQQVSHQINNSYDLKALSSSICSIATQTLGAQYAALYHIEAGCLKVVEDLAVFKSGGSGLLKMLKEANSRPATKEMLPEEAGFLTDVIFRGKPMAIEDLDVQPELCPEVIREHMLCSVLATPLLTEREVFGVLLIGTQERHAFTPSEREMLGDLGQQATGAFITSKLYHQTLEEKHRADLMVERLKYLNEAMADIGKHLNVESVCEALVTNLPRFIASTHQSIFLYRDDAWDTPLGSKTLAEEPPLAWRQALSGDYHVRFLDLQGRMLIGSPYEDFERVLVFPLMIKQELLGMVVLGGVEVFDEAALELVETLIGNTALTISNASMVEKVERQAITDGLTGVFNRRYFNDRLESELQRARRYGHQLSLIIMDIDYFKKANDVLGHLGGDTVLKELAALLHEKVRKVDIVARYGGEEFGIILPETTLESGLYVADKIRSWIEEYPFTDQERLPHKNITASLGVATFPLHADSVEELILNADEALYEAKQAGRNRVGQTKSI